MKIKQIHLPHGLVLAPMAGVTDRTFRRLCRRMGAELIVSEMVSAKAICYEEKSKKKTSTSLSLASVEAEDLPMAVQIFGAEPSFMAEGARLLCRYQQPSALDINMGCPVRKIVSNGEGSALMRDPVLAGKIIEAVVKAVEIPVTVKLRAGWDSGHINAPELARVAEASGASAVCVHARTREQFYSPGIDLEVIKNTKDAVSIPVIGNGDIFSYADAKAMMDATGCDGIMIGRGAMGNPWLFSEIVAGMEGKCFEIPCVSDRLSLAEEQLFSMIEHKGERVGLAEAKKHMAWYLSGLHGAAAARTAIMNAKKPDEIVSIFTILKQENRD